MIRSKRKTGAWIFAFLLLFLAATPRVVHGAVAIEPDREGSIFVELDDVYPELSELSVPVNLYRIAEVTVDGTYKALPAYQALDASLSSVNDLTNADTWLMMAAKAAEIVETTSPDVTATITLEAGSGTASELSTGMYLVMAQSVESVEYTYSFIPYLLSLPGNDYYSTGDDTWNYDLSVGLKPQQDNRLGRLIIEKTLTSYNATLGGASFIFQVEAVRDGEKVYSNVVSLVFDGPGTKSIELEGLPAGATVTVKEVYTGASYQAVTSPVQTTVIVADGMEGAPASVSFENTYDEHLRGGTSVVNRFIHNEDGSFDWEQE